MASRAEWQRRVTQWKKSGQTAEVFAARQGLNPGTLRWWSSALQRPAARGAPIGFARLVAADAGRLRCQRERHAEVVWTEVTLQQVDPRRLGSPHDDDLGRLELSRHPTRQRSLGIQEQAAPWRRPAPGLRELPQQVHEEVRLARAQPPEDEVKLGQRRAAELQRIRQVRELVLLGDGRQGAARPRHRARPEPRDSGIDAGATDRHELALERQLAAEVQALDLQVSHGSARTRYTHRRGSSRRTGRRSGVLRP
jgi:hypothetical protein